ncbi:anti-sigma factor [Tautonia rosea]|uniref:hypothetical protein n=1 Tax=Tautonia rosea TaxID=2728037 RepID=UPI00147423BE|nr:hypothetical protein [Tautonia rosea]
MADHLRLTADERADLVAFLDGELAEERVRLLEEKLTRSLSGRREIESLKSTWDLLDLLPRSPADDAFTERTITLASERPAGDDRLVGAARTFVRRCVSLLIVLAVLTLSSLVGYTVTRWVWPDRTARLAHDLTIAERLDDYQAVGQFDFLRRLDESTLFKEASD